jgi:hypothetical protein
MRPVSAPRRRLQCVWGVLYELRGPRESHRLAPPRALCRRPRRRSRRRRRRLRLRGGPCCCLRRLRRLRRLQRRFLGAWLSNRPICTAKFVVTDKEV